MAIGTARKRSLIAREEYQRKRTIEEAQHKIKHALNIKIALIFSNIFHENYQTVCRNVHLKKRKLMLSSKRHKRKVKKNLLNNIEKPIPLSLGEKKLQKTCLLYFNHYGLMDLPNVKKLNFKRGNLCQKI
jgi:hypothetical protein